MGGFVIDTHPTSPEEDEFIIGSPRITVTSSGMLFLAQHGCLPDVTRETINDKSKADHITKGLALLQASWIIVQCIARLASHLPITLLEILTLGHVFCAFIVYSFWWNKPLDVWVPLAISNLQIRQMAAFLTKDATDNQLNWYPMHQKPADAQTPFGNGANGRLAPPSREMAEEASASFRIRPGVETRNMIRSHSPEWDTDTIGECWAFVTPDKHESYSKIDRDEAMAWLVTSFLSSCYGSFYIAAWFAAFPTPIEETLWRLSSVSVASSGLLLGGLSQLLNPLQSIMFRIERGPFVVKTVAFLLAFLLSFFYLGAITGFIAGYGCSRIYLFVEAFLSIRSLPLAAYRTPNWTQWIPHL